MKTINLFAFVIIAVVLACNAPTSMGQTPKTNSKYSGVSEQTIDNLLSAYIELKDAFVATDSKLAKKKAERLLTYISEKENTVLGDITSPAKNIMNKTDVESQRAEFEVLSKEMYQLIKDTESNSVTIYKQYCPMAFNNKGAFWLSTDKTVVNPYFGKRMLHCGKVDEILTSGK